MMGTGCRLFNRASIPSSGGDALEQVGVCYHLEKDYASALDNYEAAIRVGADAGHLADNIVGAVRAGDDRINVDVLRRDSPDEGPVTHSVVTEIYYILEGGGDFATGGTLVDPKPMVRDGKPTNPASIGPSMKGTSVEGGTSHHVETGDVVMIPPNVAHGFVKLDGHVVYMVVRVNPDYEKGK